MNLRVIPCLLLDQGRLVKTMRFRDPTYVGDPINAVRVFNDKEVDEIFVLDISVARRRGGVDVAVVDALVGEAFMPMCFGGGIKTVEDADRVFSLGVEKVSVNTATIEHPNLIAKLANRFGSQSVVAVIDVAKRRIGGDRVITHGGTRVSGVNPVRHAKALVDAGAGEIVVQSVERDGTRTGYDLSVLTEVSGAVSVPVVALGGAGSVDDFVKAFAAGATAVAAGTMFVLHGPRRAALISYLSPDDRARLDALTVGERPPSGAAP